MDEYSDQETPRTPFWIQKSSKTRRVDYFRRSVFSLVFNSGVLIIFLLILALFSIFFIIPSFVSFTSNFFNLKPNLVKKSWDSLNLVLVLVALAFGFLSRNINNDQTPTPTPTPTPRSSEDVVKSPVKWAPHEWYDFPEQPIVGLRRHRSTSSYPDLRELGQPYRFSDDTHLRYDRYYFRQEQDLGVKEDVFLDTVVENEVVVAPQPPQPSSPPPPPVTKSVRTYHSVAKNEVEQVGIMEKNEELKLPEKEEKLPENQDSGHRERVVRRKGKGERRRARSSEPRKMVVENDDLAPEPSSPVAAAVEVLPEIQAFEHKVRKLERKKSGANATKEFFTSFYLKKKKKRQRHKSVDNLDTFLTHRQPAAVNFHLPPPSPPPPPPPSVFNNLFTSKKERRKKVGVTTPPAPPPLPPKRTAARAPKPTTTTRVSPFVTEKPRKPVKMSFFNGIDDSSSGGESPMSRIPPPPPMPPFKMPDWKFAVEGDYVRVQSTLSSECGSPVGDGSQSPFSATASPRPAFCPSPNVDTKADTFIARFRAGLKLEKINSFNQNQSSRMSNLGPGPGPSQSYRL